MKLLQLNIWGGRILRKVVDFVEAERPDILCLQEVLQGPHELEFLERQFSSLQTIVKALGYEHFMFSPADNFTYGDYPVSQGNAIISRYPLMNQRTVFTSGQSAVEHDVALDSPNIRNLQIAQLEVDGSMLTIANHHGYWQAQPMGNEMTSKSFEIAAAALRQIDGPLILAGDLNVVAEAPAMRVFDSFLEDLTVTHAISSTLSVLGKAVDVPCDHILISPGVSVKEFRVSETLVSDHKPLLLEFEL